MAEIEPTPPVTPPITPPVEPPVEPPVTPPVDDGSKTPIPPEVAAALRKANKEAETLRLKLKEFEDRDKTAEQKVLEERDALKVDNEKLKIESLRRDVASEKGIDPKAAKYLQGATREEMEAAADELVAVLKPSKPVFGNVGQGKTGDAVAGRIYTNEELKDSAFFKANQADIMRAQKEGRIKQD
jgi:hypothetical protein